MDLLAVFVYSLHRSTHSPPAIVSFIAKLLMVQLHKNARPKRNISALLNASEHLVPESPRKTLYVPVARPLADFFHTCTVSLV